MEQSLILVRGLPGSGKSTLANMMAEYIVKNSELAATVCEADKYFEQNGKYLFEPNKIQTAHIWCELQTAKYLKAGNTVIVANTFVQLWEMKAYRAIAQDYNIPLVIYECKGNYGSIHGVPQSTIERMKAKWENLQ